ncbi:hypothetical protein LguiA_033696 [Lonicera macranthoides]
MKSQSPPTKGCCFWSSSPNKEKKKSTNLQRSESKDKIKGQNEETILSDVSTFSVEEQERRLKMAIDEEQRISREAERVVNWVKQQSARMDASSIKNIVLSDDDDHDSIKK